MTTFGVAMSGPLVAALSANKARCASSAAEPDASAAVTADAAGVDDALGGTRNAANAASVARFDARVGVERVGTARAGVVARGAWVMPASCVRRADSAGRGGDARDDVAAGVGDDGALAMRDDGDAGLDR